MLSFSGFRPLGGLKDHLLVALDRLVVDGVIPEDHHVPVLRVLEEVEDPLLLEEAADEIHVRLAVLDAEFSQVVLVLQPELVAVGRDAGLLEDVGDNFGDVLVLEDAAVLLQGKQHQGRHDVGLVEKLLAAYAGVLELPHDAVEVPIGLGPRYGQQRLFLDDIVILDLGGAGQGDVDHKRFGDALLRLEIGNLDLWRPLDLEEKTGLRTFTGRYSLVIPSTGGFMNFLSIWLCLKAALL